MEGYHKILFRHNNVDEERIDIEGAWAIKVGQYYKLENILFYALGYSIGDIVEVNEVDGELFVECLIEESGHSTIRLYIFDVNQVEEIRREFKSLGCTSELSNIPKLIAIDVPKDIDYKEIKNSLEEGKSQGKWDYEESCLAHSI